MTSFSYDRYRILLLISIMASLTLLLAGFLVAHLRGLIEMRSVYVGGSIIAIPLGIKECAGYFWPLFAKRPALEIGDDVLIICKLNGRTTRIERSNILDMKIEGPKRWNNIFQKKYLRISLATGRKRSIKLRVDLLRDQLELKKQIDGWYFA